MDKPNSNVIISYADNAELDKDAVVKVFRTNNHVEEIAVENQYKRKGTQIPLGNNQYFVPSTGEIKVYNTENILTKRTGSYDNIRRLVNNNFSGCHSELHITLTYYPKLYDHKQLSHDFANFMKRFIYHYGRLDYIRIYEQHKEGGWHIHLLVKTSSRKKLFIPEKHLSTLWRHGYIQITKTSHYYNLGQYFSTSDKRNQLFPRGLRIYTSSKNIIVPESIEMTHGEVAELYGNSHKKEGYCTEVKAKAEDGEILINRIHKNFYSLQ